MAPSALSELMKASQAGDQTSYKVLLRQLRPIIQSYLKKRIFDQNSIEDICQEILLKVHAYRHTYDPSQLFESWLFTICRNQAIDFMRARGRRKEVLAIESDSEPTVSVAADGEARIALENALARLTPDQREAIELAKIDGLSLEEVAKRTGSSLSAVKVRTHRALKVIHETMFGTDPKR